MHYRIKISSLGEGVRILDVAFSQLCELLGDTRPEPAFWNAEAEHIAGVNRIKILRYI
ncbi:hypothetical protein [Nostoc phage Nsp-JY18]